MRGLLVSVAWLTIVWVALWGEFTPANIAGGVAVAALAMRMVPVREVSGVLTLRPLAAARLIVYFAWKLVQASAIVAWEVVTPRSHIREGIIAVPVRGVADFITTLVANAVSLTPGTLTLEAHRDPPVLYIHVLHLRDIEAVRSDVLRLEKLAIDALVRERPGDPPHTKPAPNSKESR